MRFDDELRGYLEGIGRDERAGRGLTRSVDEHSLHAHLLGLLRRHSAPDVVIAELHATWAPKLEELARYVEALPRTAAPIAPELAQAFAEQLVTVAIDRAPDLSAVDVLDGERHLAAFHRRKRLKPYALECHLTTLVEPTTGPLRLTSLARIFLQLRGKDAIRWLLTLEVSQSHGSEDPWRISRDALADASSPQKLVRWMNMEGDEVFAYARESLARAAALGVLDAWAPAPGDEVDAYSVRDEFRDVVASVLESGPWHLAIRALLDDERGAVVPSTAMPTSATEATIDQARMMAHEVRNALVPARHHLDALLDAGAADRPRIEKARRGVVRVLDFVDQLVATADLVTEPHTRCSLTEVFAEACGRIETGDRVHLFESSAVPLLHAPRQRLVIALANLIQNALQVAPAPGRVQLSWAAVSDELHIHVDDGGPGVPPADRLRIFDDGYTTRPGGSGFGLAYVRKVVESSLRGRVWCEDSDLGGARFVIAIPTKSP